MPAIVYKATATNMLPFSSQHKNQTFDGFFFDILPIFYFARATLQEGPLYMLPATSLYS